jgi:hypothetical protein
MSNYNFKIDSMLTLNLPPDKLDYVLEVNYSIVDSSDPSKVLLSQEYILPFDPKQANFVSYADLTEEVVLGWIKSDYELKKSSSLDDSSPYGRDPRGRSNFFHPTPRFRGRIKNLPWSQVEINREF